MVPPVPSLRRAIVIQERPNPSSDYFVFPYLRESRITYQVLNHDSTINVAEEMLDGALVVLVRYVPRVWAKALERWKNRIEGLIYFMDDDLFSISASAGLPLRYRWKLAHLATWRQSWLRRMGAELCVSNAYLADKYAAWRPRLIQPRPIVVQLDEQAVRVFYHGSASHRQEIAWLYPVIEAVLTRDDAISFEIIGDGHVNRLFRTLPRVTVVHPMTWESYLCFSRHGRRDIGLAPLLPHPFSRARSSTKFFDITRSGAVGIYGNVAPYADFVRHGEDGILLAHDPNTWVEAILQLSSDLQSRQRLISAADARVKSLGVRDPV